MSTPPERPAESTRIPPEGADRASVWCIVVAAGSGRRFGAAKQFARLAGTRVVDISVATAVRSGASVVVVLPSSEVDGPSAEVPGAAAVVAGGATRSASVRAGLAAVPTDANAVLVHDAARPLATATLFRRVAEAVLAGAAAVVPVVPVSDTIRRVGGGVVDRDELRAVQTPQGFDAETLRRLHADGPEATDDAGLVELAGGVVELVEGEPTNLKLTGPDDLAVAEVLLGRLATGGRLADPDPAGGDS